MKKVADQLVDQLVRAGIKRIYAITGDSLNELNDAVRRRPDLQWIHVRNEEAGAFAASADAQLSGIACCAGSSGPGHVHLINGLYDAQRSGAPVVAIASTCATREFGSGYFQETNVIKLFEDCSHFTQVAATAEQCPRMAQAVIQTAADRASLAKASAAAEAITSPAADGRGSAQYRTKMAGVMTARALSRAFARAKS